MDKKASILFLCTGNSCRSQMAEGWTRQLKGEEFEVASAGVAPQPVDPRAVQVMAEAGVDISGQTSKDAGQFTGRSWDYVVTLCDNARESCPYFPGLGRLIHRGFDDPPFLAQGATSEEEALAPYRRVRDEIRQMVEGLPKSLED
ncbi:MAG: arsenate reductase ArsC [Deltaproteobacteria bacterium]|nr:arsenate reductase ArsC [Deltaproteobacteria bacterium]